MSTEIAYELVDDGSNGKIVIAKRDFLPGELVICEKEPLVHFTRSFLEMFKDPAETPYYNAICQATFYKYMMNDMSSDQKERFLSLYCTSTRKNTEELHHYAQKKVKWQGRRLVPAEVDLYVKIALVVKMNLETDTQDFYVFEHLSRVGHSCLRNCEKFAGSARAIQPIKAGEEIIISYTNYRDVYPTHLRRQKYLETKEFTCHCPRCDAPGDDTRQFDCCWCKEGLMMVCHPINQEEVSCGLQYTGVEYVEPHLLPCTECHRTTSPEYEFNMLFTEHLIELATATCEGRLRMLESRFDAGMFDLLLPEMQSYVFPKRHLLTVPFLGVLMRVLSMKASACIAAGQTREASAWLKRTRETAKQFIAGQKGVLPWAHDTTYEALRRVCQTCIVAWPHPAPRAVFPNAEAKALLQKTLRMKLVRDGRESRDPKLEAALVSALLLLMPTAATSEPIQSMEVCAFCEESPANAFMKRSRCGACKKVMYCSAGCQKAHWKLHKKTCDSSK